MFNKLASLLVDIVIDTRQFNEQINHTEAQLATLFSSQKNKWQALRVESALYNASLANIARTAFKFAAVLIALQLIKQAMLAIVDAASKVEKGFVDIERIVPALSVGTFRQEVVNLAQSLSGVTLHDLQEALKEIVQLGIRGKDALLEFGKVVSELSLLTGESAKDIAENLGKIVNIFNIDPKNVSHFANATLALSQTFGATEKEIFTITERLGEFAHEIGLSAEDTAAFAAAMKNAGQQTDASRNALFTLFTKLEAHPLKVADAFGLTQAAAQRLFITLRQNPREGIIKFLEILRGKSPGEMIQALGKLGISGKNTAAGIIALVGNLAQLKEAFHVSAVGAKENVLLTQQMAANALTLSAKVADLEKNWELFLASLGNTSIIKNTVDELKDLLKVMTDITNFIQGKTGGLAASGDKDAIIARMKAIMKELDEEKRFNAEGDKLIWRAGNLEIPIGRIIQNIMFGRGFFGSGNATYHKNLVDELIKLTKVLQDLNKAEEDKKKGVKKEDKKPPTAADAANEFNKLWKADEKEKKHSHSMKHPDGIFSGFMDLTTAWKNLILQTMQNEGADNPQLKKLEDIWKEEAVGNDLLGQIDNTLKTRTFPAVVV